MEIEALKINQQMLPLDSWRLLACKIMAWCTSVCQVDNRKGITYFIRLHWTLWPVKMLLVVVLNAGCAPSLACFLASQNRAVMHTENKVEQGFCLFVFRCLSYSQSQWGDGVLCALQLAGERKKGQDRSGAVMSRTGGRGGRWRR